MASILDLMGLTPPKDSQSAVQQFLMRSMADPQPKEEMPAPQPQRAVASALPMGSTSSVRSIKPMPQPSIIEEPTVKKEHGFEDDVADQQASIKDRIRNALQTQDPSTSYALGAVLTGNKTLQELAGKDYKYGAGLAGEIEDKSNANILKLREAIAAREAKSSDSKYKTDQNNLYKEQLAQIKASTPNPAGSAREDANVGREIKNIYNNKTLMNINDTDRAIAKAQNVLKKSEGGKLTINSPVWQDIQQDVAQALQGARKSSTGNERESLHINSLEEKFKKIKELVTSSPQGVVLPEHMINLSSLMQDLIHSNADAKETTLKIMEAGNDSFSSDRVKKARTDQIEVQRTSKYADPVYMYNSGAKGGLSEEKEKRRKELQEKLGK